MAYLQVENLSFSYPNGEKNTLNNVNLSIERGEYVVICGKSGSGKTTLLRHFKPALTPYGTCTGTVTLDAVPVKSLSQKEQATKIGYVMQNPEEQLVTDKVWHELSFGLENLGCDVETMRARVGEMASYFGLQNWFTKEVETLSGGQKQLLNLASVMAMHPEVLILDEPTSQLDPIAASDFLNTIYKINRDLGVTVVITEHRLEDILPVADRVVVMEAGSVIQEGTPLNVARRLWEAQNPMFFAMPAPVRTFYRAGSEGACPLTVREGRTWLSGQFSNAPAVAEIPETETPDSPVAMSVKNLWFRYERDGEDVLRGVNLQIPKGEFSAIVGGNGTGKSTLLKALCGAVKPYRGRIDRQNCKISMLPQDPRNLFVKDTVAEELSEMTQDKTAISQMGELCNLSDLLERNPYDLSGGEQQRVALAKVLLTKPDVLLLDEPTKGMDCFHKQALAQLIDSLLQRGVTVLMVSHDVEFCAKYAKRVSMFFDGQMLATASPRTFFSRNRFYTTAASRMSRHLFRNAVTAQDVVFLCNENEGGAL